MVNPGLMVEEPDVVLDEVWLEQRFAKVVNQF
jgi:hypothetical protein